MTASLAELIIAHNEALAAYDADHETHDQQNDVTGFAVDAARDALLAHRPTTLEEVAIKATYMAANRTFTEWDNFEQVQLIQALTPTPREPSKLPLLIATFHEATAVRDAAWARGDDDADGPEQVDLEVAEDAVLRFPCQTLDEVRVKAQFFLNNSGPYDTIRNCFDAKEETLLPFLRSLAGGAS